MPTVTPMAPIDRPSPSLIRLLFSGSAGGIVWLIAGLVLLAGGGVFGFAMLSQKQKTEFIFQNGTERPAIVADKEVERDVHYSQGRRRTSRDYYVTVVFFDNGGIRKTVRREVGSGLYDRVPTEIGAQWATSPEALERPPEGLASRICTVVWHPNYPNYPVFKGFEEGTGNLYWMFFVGAGLGALLLLVAVFKAMGAKSLAAVAPATYGTVIGRREDVEYSRSGRFGHRRRTVPVTNIKYLDAEGQSQLLVRRGKRVRTREPVILLLSDGRALLASDAYGHDGVAAIRRELDEAGITPPEGDDHGRVE